MLWPRDPWGWPQPMITSSTSCGPSRAAFPGTALIGGGQDLRLVAPDRRQGLVDLLEDLLGLALGVRRRIGRDHAGEVHRVAVDDRLAQSRSDAVPLDGHRLILSTPEMGGL